MNFELRTPDNKLPYTITILPAFCIPWGRYTVEKIIAAVFFVATGCGSFVAAALNLGTDTDPRTVIRYYQRFASRISEWTPVLASFLTKDLGASYSKEHTPATVKTGFTIAWSHLRELIDSICDRLEVLPGNTRPTEPLGYALAVIGFRTKALGP